MTSKEKMLLHLLNEKETYDYTEIDTLIDKYKSVEVLNELMENNLITAYLAPDNSVGGFKITFNGKEVINKGYTVTVAPEGGFLKVITSLTTKGATYFTHCLVEGNLLDKHITPEAITKLATYIKSSKYWHLFEMVFRKEQINLIDYLNKEVMFEGNKYTLISFNEEEVSLITEYNYSLSVPKIEFINGLK